ncbi:MAG: hypothetical protein K2Q06_13940 [Parvularculaceae bacterium]|nr:hypothetical protein [Parvularculaceae bacterium]
MSWGGEGTARAPPGVLIFKSVAPPIGTLRPASDPAGEAWPSTPAWVASVDTEEGAGRGSRLRIEHDVKPQGKDVQKAIVSSIIVVCLIASGAAAAQVEQRAPKMKTPSAAKPAASSAQAGSIGFCVSRLLYREEAGLTAANGNGRTTGGQEVAFYFTAAGGVIILNTSNAVVPATTSGWTADKTNDLVDLVAAAAVNRRPVTFEYGSSTTTSQPVTGVQVSPGEDECKF